MLFRWHLQSARERLGDHRGHIDGACKHRTPEHQQQGPCMSLETEGLLYQFCGAAS
jgi:hypothetical protein